MLRSPSVPSSVHESAGSGAAEADDSNAKDAKYGAVRLHWLLVALLAALDQWEVKHRLRTGESRLQPQILSCLRDATQHTSVSTRCSGAVESKLEGALIL